VVESPQLANAKQETAVTTRRHTDWHFPLGEEIMAMLSMQG
jgi:hypothetical protein